MAAGFSGRKIVLLFTMMLILWKFQECHVEADIFGKVTGRKFQNITVYDVSEVIYSDKNHIGTDILPSDQYVREPNGSTKYYFVATDSAFMDDCWEENQNIQRCGWVGIEGISIMFFDEANKSDVLAMKNLTMTKTTIVDLLKMNNSSIHSISILVPEHLGCSAITDVKNYLIEKLKIYSLKSSVKIGIEYNDDFLKHCTQEFIPLLESFNLDHTILRIHVSPLTTMLLYHSFFQKMHWLIQNNRLFVLKFHSECTLYIRLQNEGFDEIISPDNYDRYKALITTYLRKFSRQDSGDEVYIFNPTSERVKVLPNNVFFRQNVLLRYDASRFPGFKTTSWICTHQGRVKSMLSNVQNIVVDEEVLGSLLAPCKTLTGDAQNIFTPPSNTSLSVVMGPLEDKFEKITKMLGKSKTEVKVESVYTRVANVSKTESLTKVVSLLQSRNTKICCIPKIEIDTKNVSAIIDETIEQCEPLLNFSKEIIQVFDFTITKDADLLKILSRVHKAKQFFEGLYPGKTLTPVIPIPGSLYGNDNSLYCEPDRLKIAEYFQTVCTFANIHRWSRLMSWTNTQMGIWGLVNTNDEIKGLQQSFPVLFRTNAPPNANDELPMTYPCIRRTLNASQSYINFSINLHSGATFQTNLRKAHRLSPTELNTTLHLAMQRFSSVELTAVSREDFKLVEKVIVANSRNFHILSKHSTPFMYIETPLANAHSLRKAIGSVLSSKQSGVHVSHWESLSDEQLNQWEGFQQISKPNFGVTVQNCSQEMISGLSKLKSLPFMPQVSYVVCNVPPVVPNNLSKNQMNEYLGTLFYTKSYMEHFLTARMDTGNKVEVMFRLNYNCIKEKQMDLFLRFLNDVNQHSAAYKIRYFLVRAFEEEGTSLNCSNSWWRLDSYADLSNISTYVNREDEFAGREARIPYKPPHDTEENSNDSNSAYLTVILPTVALVVLAALAILALWLHHQRAKTRILTKVEVIQFYNGNPQKNTNKDFQDFGHVKFSNAYEIPRKHIDTEEIIGKGQFGIVHRGFLSKRTEVAIKIPRPNCDKEQFKSTLSELKVLCHIGEHLNIVSFLGACTKDIAMGNLYIVLEYCKNGCLVNYLREHRETSGEDSLSLFEMYGFCLQIASGMEYIAEKRVVHGDLAARNVLLTEEMTCKIADFGLSRRLYEMNEYKKTSQEPLPWRWMAPESLQDMQFTTKSDVWSYGVTLWEIFSLGMVPYPALTWTANYVTELKNGMRMEKAPHATQNIHAKMLDCWNINSEARPSFTELKEFFIGLRNEEYIRTDQV